MKRQANEDAFKVFEGDRVFLVADGMGGHASGEVASTLSTETVGEFYERTKDRDATWPHRFDPKLSYAENRLTNAVLLANRRILETSRQNPRLRGMGTTIVGLQVLGRTGFVFHVGDSRVYRYANGALRQLTCDHSLFEEYKRARPDVTPEELENFPHRNVITRALGMRDDVAVEITRIDIEDGDRFLLCSDGLSGMLSDAELQMIAGESDNLDMVVARMIDEANRAGGTDNITAVLVECRFDAEDAVGPPLESSVAQ